MTVQNVAFVRSIDEKAVVNATTRAGWITGLGVRSDNSLEYYVSTTDADGKSVAAWMNAADLSDWVEPAITTISSLAYFQLFTNVEQLAIFGSDIPQVRQAVAFTQAAQTIDLTDATVRGGIDALVGYNLVTSDRAARIKTGQPPLSA